MQESLDKEALKEALTKVLEHPDFQQELPGPSLLETAWKSIKELITNLFTFAIPEGSETASWWGEGSLLALKAIIFCVIFVYLVLFLKKSPFLWQIVGLSPPIPALKALIVAKASWEKDLAQGHLRQALRHMHRDWLRNKSLVSA